MHKAFFVFAALGLLVAGSAGAVTIDLTGAAGKTAAATGQLVDATLGTITFQAEPKGSPVTWTAGDGLGIDCVGAWYCVADQTDEIDTFEILTVSFSAPVVLDGIRVSNLYVDKTILGLVVEGGYVYGGSFAYHFDALDDGNNDGWLDVAIGQGVSWIKLTAEGGWTKDFSLAGLTARRLPTPTPTPEPVASALFLSGLGIVGWITLRRAA